MRSCPYAIALAALAAMASSASASLGLNAYEVDGSDPGAARTLAEAGFDVHEGGGGEAIEIIASRSQVAGLRKQGLDPELKVVDGVAGSASSRSRTSTRTGPTTSTARTSTTAATQTTGPRRPATPNTNEPRPTLYQEMLAARR